MRREATMILEDIGSFLLRLTVGWLFVMGAWGVSKDANARDFAIRETALVFKWRPELAALAGILMMGAGGLSILLGVFPRIGAFVLAIFLIPGALIHFAKRSQAIGYKDKVLTALTDKPDSQASRAVNALASSAVMGHYVSALKNLSLLGPTLYLVFAGTREPMLLGFGPNWRLQGLLAQLF